MSREPERWAIEFYVDPRGKRVVEEYIDALPDAEQATVYLYLRHLRDQGTLLGMPYARALKGHKTLWELRPGGHRLLYFAQVGRRFVVLHAAKKQRQKLRREVIEIAERRLDEIRERER